MTLELAEGTRLCPSNGRRTLADCHDRPWIGSRSHSDRV